MECLEELTIRDCSFRLELHFPRQRFWSWARPLSGRRARDGCAWRKLSEDPREIFSRDGGEEGYERIEGGRFARHVELWIFRSHEFQTPINILRKLSSCLPRRP